MKEDRRKRKSKTALKRAMVELMVKKPFSHITVTEICESADVNRSTFYANYTDLQSLLSDVHMDIFDTMVEHANTYLNEEMNSQKKKEVMLHHMISYVETHKKIIRTLFQNGQNQLVATNMVLYFMEKYVPKDSTVTSQYSFYYHTIAFFALLERWISDNYPCSSHELAQVILHESEQLKITKKTNSSGKQISIMLK